MGIHGEEVHNVLGVRSTGPRPARTLRDSKWVTLGRCFHESDCVLVNLLGPASSSEEALKLVDSLGSPK